MKKKNILITGGAGFIGSHFAKTCVLLGHKVTIIDNLSRGTMINIEEIKKNIRFVDEDIKNIASIAPFFTGIDAVVNLAALNTGVDFDIGHTEYMFHENMLLQMNPIKAAAASGVSKFLQISSASIYSRKAMEQRVPIKESDDQGNPEPSKEGYAYAKRMGEKLALWYGQNTPMHTVIIRPINTYGTRDHFDEKGHFIPCMIRKFLTTMDTVDVFGSGKQKRSYVAVEDLVDALLLLMERGSGGETYNIDAQDEHSVKEIVMTIHKLVGKNVAVRFNLALPEGSQRRVLDNKKIQSLGWTPKKNLIDALPSLIDDIRHRLHEKGH